MPSHGWRFLQPICPILARIRNLSSILVHKVDRWIVWRPRYLGEILLDIVSLESVRRLVESLVVRSIELLNNLVNIRFCIHPFGRLLAPWGTLVWFGVSWLMVWACLTLPSNTFHVFLISKGLLLFDGLSRFGELLPILIFRYLAEFDLLEGLDLGCFRLTCGRLLLLLYYFEALRSILISFSIISLRIQSWRPLLLNVIITVGVFLELFVELAHVVESLLATLSGRWDVDILMFWLVAQRIEQVFVFGIWTLLLGISFGFLLSIKQIMIRNGDVRHVFSLVRYVDVGNVISPVIFRHLIHLLGAISIPAIQFTVHDWLPLLNFLHLFVQTTLLFTCGLRPTISCALLINWTEIIRNGL